MRVFLLIISGRPAPTTNTDKSKPVTKSYSEGWERVFGQAQGSTASN